MGLRALLALCATPLVAGFGGLTYLRSIEDIEELHAPTVDTEGVQCASASPRARRSR